MHWKDITPYIAAALLFLCLQVAPSLKTFTDYLVTSSINKRERKLQSAVDRADKAAEQIYEQLDILVHALPDHYRTQWQARDDEGIAAAEVHRVRRDEALAIMEAQIVLLPPAMNLPMKQVLELLRTCEELSAQHSPSGGWHPDSVWTIAHNTVAYAREVLAAQLSRRDPPSEPPAVTEYLIAADEYDEDMKAEWAPEIEKADEALSRWRTARGLPARRPES